MLFILGWIMCPSLNRWHGNIDGIMLIKWVRAKLGMGSSVIQTIWLKKFGVLLRREEGNGCWGGRPQCPPQWLYCLQIDGLFLLIWNRGSQPWPDCLGRGRVLLCGFLCSPRRVFNGNAGLCPLDASTSSPSSNNQNCLSHDHMSLGWGA